MCRTPEEAAWTVLSQKAGDLDLKVVVKLVREYGLGYSTIDVIPNLPHGTKTIKANMELVVTDELWKHVLKEVEHEPTLVD